MPTPTVTIRYKNLSVKTSALIGDKDLPTLPHAVQHALFSFLEAKRPLSIVDNASGILRPGRLTLMLGPPSSGKTTFMKALVGRYRHSSDLKVCSVGVGMGRVVDAAGVRHCHACRALSCSPSVRSCL